MKSENAFAGCFEKTCTVLGTGFLLYRRSSGLFNNVFHKLRVGRGIIKRGFVVDFFLRGGVNGTFVYILFVKVELAPQESCLCITSDCGSRRWRNRRFVFSRAGLLKLDE
jgi:hypothetical protein